MKTIIHINQHLIGKKDQHGQYLPCITVKTYKSNTYCTKVKIGDVATVHYEPESNPPIFITTHDNKRIIVRKFAIKQNCKLPGSEKVLDVSGEHHNEYEINTTTKITCQLP
jgi:hypothetical protein